MKKLKVLSVLIILVVLLTHFSPYTHAKKIEYKTCEAVYIGQINKDLHELKVEAKKENNDTNLHRSGQGFCIVNTNNTTYYVCAVIRRSKAADGKTKVSEAERNSDKTHLYILDKDFKITAIIGSTSFGHANSLAYYSGNIYIIHDNKIDVVSDSVINQAIKAVKNKSNKLITGKLDAITNKTTYTFDKTKTKNNDAADIRCINFDENGQLFGSNVKGVYKLSITKTKKLVSTKLLFELPYGFKFDDYSQAIEHNAGLAIKDNKIYLGRFYSKNTYFGDPAKGYQNIIDIFDTSGAYVASYIFNDTMESDAEIEGVQLKGNTMSVFFNGCGVSNHIVNLDLNNISMVKIKAIMKQKSGKEIVPGKNELEGVILNSKNEIVTNAHTNKNGNFKFKNLKPDSYTLKITKTATNFKSIKNKTITFKVTKDTIVFTKAVRL